MAPGRSKKSNPSKGKKTNKAPSTSPPPPSPPPSRPKPRAIRRNDTVTASQTDSGLSTEEAKLLKQLQAKMKSQTAAALQAEQDKG